jgi:proteasome lid subunit RPN8/RPN11
MIRIEPAPWQIMVDHAKACFPRECCGIMLGTKTASDNLVSDAVACINIFPEARNDRFEIDPKEYAAAERKADEMGLGVIGFFHSHPNEDSYFSATDLKYSWPWYSNVVISVRDGNFNRARSFIVNLDQTAADEEELHYPEK